ncbi:site-specific DNA-methyltransferase [Thermosynechococcus sp. B0]|nr:MULTISPECIES: site-specific DNA-methyltransferase [unclassified Thermosynechococcus]WJI25248.1 site-specific DNA-methyltransferase [Thermosynechococcus sp. B0]WJI27776.1 site-specific DNA-methyltransferase [Thermosynechococcus sp. B1]WJI30310.1 site-specific DNA-methyltransferase [Thermosynechococcus sp. B3]WKT84892.1 site-specific DNA-methyltransferase [Thermosynechococcus sp. HY596]WNC64026.1 site-specific DNA-methyltransferase [Thermosynechococcus sp. HY591]
MSSGQHIQERFSPEAKLVVASGDVCEVIRQVPDEAMTLIFTSPPYNLGKAYETPVAIEDYLQSQSEVITELYRVLRPEGSLCWQVGNFVQGGEVYPLDILFYPLFKRLGLKLRNRIIWKFGHGLHATKRFSGRYETILWFTKSDHYIFNLDAVRIPAKYPGKRHFKGPNKGKPSGNPLGKNPSDVWEILLQDWQELVWDIPNVKFNHPEKTLHPCQFPIELVERCVLALSHEGDWVFDPYMGVGSSLLAALMHNRRAMGCEKEPAYVNIARQRIQAYENGTLPYRPLGRPVYAPTGHEKIAQVPEEWQQ